MSGYHKVKSLKSNNPLFVAFCNRTNRNVALVWHDYDGKLHWYVTFSPGCVHERRTFENHAWSAYDSDTLDKLLIGQTFVFNPTIPNQDTKQDICVERAYIDIPGKRTSIIFLTHASFYIGIRFYFWLC